MKVIILAAGQGTRLRPLTDDRPKCMVEIHGRAILRRQLDTMLACGIREEDVTIVAGYRSDVLEREFSGTKITILVNEEFETTNMVCSLMCAKPVMEQADDVLVSYGDIVYDTNALRAILKETHGISVVVDDGWHAYWAKRCENPLDDAETLLFDAEDFLTEIGQKTTEIANIQSQYIGLMRFQKSGLREMLDLACEAKRRTMEGRPLWSTDRTYPKMYMTDLLQGLIEEGSRLKAVHINRGWYEIDNQEDLKLVEQELFADGAAENGHA